MQREGQQHRRSGFTVVELLIIVIVVAVLAAVIIVAYNGLTRQAKESALLADVKTGVDTLNTVALREKGVYPASLSEAGMAAEQGEVSYYYQRTAGTRGFCLTASRGDLSAFQTSESEKPIRGTCEGMLAWWPLNSTAQDLSGNGIHGTVTGAAPTVGYGNKAGGAYQLGASGKYIYIGTPAPFANLHQKLTYSIWLSKTDVSPYQWPVIMGAANPHTGFAFRANTYGNNIYYEWGTSPFTGSTWGGTNAMAFGSTNEWHHAVATFDGSQVRLYWDGVLRHTPAATSLYPTQLPFYIGVTANGWEGKVDDARVYDRPLSAVEIKEMYDAGAQ